MDILLIQFAHYFEKLDSTKFAEWIQNAFIEKNDEFGLTTIEKEKLIELSCDTSLKQKFQRKTLILF